MYTSFGKLGEVAKGSIEPQDGQRERLAEFKKDVGSGRFNSRVEHKYICGCIDGRCGGKLRASSAGGTISVAVMWDLTHDTTGKSTNDVLTEVIGTLRTKAADRGDNVDIGDHVDDHSPENRTGCGALDNLEAEYGIMAVYGDEIRGIAARLGVDVSDDLHASLVAAAKGRIDFSDPKELIETLRSSSDDAVDTLTGPHKEVVIGINTIPGTTLDHKKLSEEYGDDYQAFCVDVWAIENTAELLAPNPKEAHAMTVAAVYQNIATALVLCGSEMEIIAIKN